MTYYGLREAFPVKIYVQIRAEIIFEKQTAGSFRELFSLKINLPGRILSLF
jgi:hypothetical protein